MEVIFCDKNYSSDLFIQDDILSLNVDAVVSPANSFGFMDGGVDYAYSMEFGWNVQEDLQRKIKDLPFGELLVGQALAIETHHNKIKWVISAPTMRVPNRIYDPADIYIAARAATKCAIEVGVDKLAFPGMGTGCGMVPFLFAEKAMKAGVDDAINGYKKFKTWQEAQEHHYGVWR